MRRTAKLHFERHFCKGFHYDILYNLPVYLSLQHANSWFCLHNFRFPYILHYFTIFLGKLCCFRLERFVAKQKLRSRLQSALQSPFRATFKEATFRHRRESSERALERAVFFISGWNYFAFGLKNWIEISSLAGLYHLYPTRNQSWICGFALFLGVTSTSPRFRDAPTYAANLLGSVPPTSNVWRTDGDLVENIWDLISHIEHVWKSSQKNLAWRNICWLVLISIWEVSRCTLWIILVNFQHWRPTAVRSGNFPREASFAAASAAQLARGGKRLSRGRLWHVNLL